MFKSIKLYLPCQSQTTRTRHSDKMSEKMENQTTNEISFKNAKCAFTFNTVTKEIGGDDLTDTNNLPRCYNRNTRSFKKALQSVSAVFNDNMNMYNVMDIIENAGVSMRSYCAMD